MRHRQVLVAVMFLTCFAHASHAIAQTTSPPSTSDEAKHSLVLDGSVGYRFAHVTGLDSGTIPAGWAASFDVTLDRKLAGVGEFTGSFGDRHHLHTVLWGARFYLPDRGRVSPFVQLLAGRGRIVEDDPMRFAIQPGAGVELKVISHLAVRLQGSWLRVNQPGDAANALRMVASILIR